MRKATLYMLWLTIESILNARGAVTNAIAASIAADGMRKKDRLCSKPNGILPFQSSTGRTHGDGAAGSCQMDGVTMTVF